MNKPRGRLKLRNKRDNCLVYAHLATPPLTRTCRVRLVIDEGTEKKLFELGDVFAKCWNEVNYLRRQQFFNKVGVDFATTERMIYEKYKKILKVNTQQVSRKNTEAWKSFFKNLKLKKIGKLPSFIIPRPPGYKKDRKKNRREPFLIIRNDRYEIEEWLHLSERF